MFLGAVAVGDCCPSQVTKKWEGGGDGGGRGVRGRG